MHMVMQNGYHILSNLKVKEWTCIGQYDDEDILLRLNPFNMMNEWDFYKNHIVGLCKSNSIACAFVSDYIASQSMQHQQAM